MPDAPGLGVTLNDEAVQEHLAEPGYFEPTSDWDNEKSWTVSGVEDDESGEGDGKTWSNGSGRP